VLYLEKIVGKTFGDSYSKQTKDDHPADKVSHDQPADQSASSNPVSSLEADLSLPVMSLMAENLVFSSNSSLITLGHESSGNLR
jgi:hypothetical protein